MEAASAPARRALITGAAGGIGRAIAQHMGARGYRVALTDRLPCDGLAAELRAGGVEVWHAPCDLGEREQIAQLVASLGDDWGGTDVLVNNAAMVEPRPFMDIEIERFSLGLKINVEAAFLLCQGLIPGMKAQGWGRVINIVSSSAWKPPSGFVSYVTSKMAMVGMTRALAAEFGNDGITVNAVTPGLTRHDNNSGALPESFWEQQRQVQAIARTGRPADLVGLVSFLAGDDAGFITGQTIVADGGAIHL